MNMSMTSASSGARIYQKASAQTGAPTAQMAFLLDRVADSVLEASIYCQSGEIEKRFLATEKAANLLIMIKGGLNEKVEDPTVQEFVQDMFYFIERMTIGLVEINSTNSPEFCQRMENTLREMAQIWRSV